MVFAQLKVDLRLLQEVDIDDFFVEQLEFHLKDLSPDLFMSLDCVSAKDLVQDLDVKGKVLGRQISVLIINP